MVVYFNFGEAAYSKGDNIKSKKVFSKAKTISKVKNNVKSKKTMKEIG